MKTSIIRFIVLIFVVVGLTSTLHGAWIAQAGPTQVLVSKTNNIFGFADASFFTRTVEFTAGDFPSGAAITDVNITIDFEKVDSENCDVSLGNDWDYTTEIGFALQSPTGTVVDLVYDQTPGPPTYNTDFTFPDGSPRVLVTFDDAAATLVGTDVADVPVSGTFRPEEPLSAFNGESPFGTWTLTIGDDILLDYLCFYSYTLDVTAHNPLVTTVGCVGNDLVVDIAIGDGPFNITATRGGSMPLSGVSEGSHSFSGPDWWQNVTVTETGGDVQSINYGDFNCGTAGVTVTPLESPMQTSEAGDSAQFSVVLNSVPEASVTIGISSDDTSEGTIPPTSLVFDDSNWNIAQIVTFTGADDDIDDGDVVYTAVTAPADSSFSPYNGLDPFDVSITNLDNDSAGFVVTPLETPMETSEAGDIAQFTVALDSEPLAEVTIPVSSDNPAEGTPDVSSLSFNSDNWHVPQTVTMTGVDDLLDDGDIAYHAVLGTASGGADYDGLDPADVAIVNLDDDSTQGGIGLDVWPTTLHVPEQARGNKVFKVRLTASPAPGEIVTVTMTWDTSQMTIENSTLFFTEDNWRIPQTVRVDAINDGVAEPPTMYPIDLTASSSLGAGSPFDGLGERVEATVYDNLDNAGPPGDDGDDDGDEGDDGGDDGGGSDDVKPENGDDDRDDGAANENGRAG